MESPTPGAAAATITRHDIRAAYDVIAPHIRRTPTAEIDLADLVGSHHAPAGRRIVLKLEHVQRAGSFKIRGAFANLLLRDVPTAGIVAASGGNHGVAVAYAAHHLGVPARIYVPTISSPVKIETIRTLGADLVVGGDRYADALAAAQEWAARSGAMQIHAFDQRETILGQGTLGLELADQVPDVTTVLVPVGGGGLIAGIATSFAGTGVGVVGVEPTGAPTLTAARKHGGPTDAPTGSVAADAMAPRRVGEIVYPLTQAHVRDVVLVDDDAILAARRALWDAARVVAEPAGAVGLAAMIAGGHVPEADERVVVVISGSNASPADLGPVTPEVGD